MTRYIKSAAIVLVAAALSFAFGLGPAQASECVKCHTNAEKLKEITEYLAKKRPSQEDLAKLSQGPSMAGPVKQVEPFKRLLITKEMFDYENHGDIACEDCHNGNPNTDNWRLAHGGLTRDPSYPAPGVCAECHEDEAKNYGKSLHHTNAPMLAAVMARAGDEPSMKKKAKLAYDYSCTQCHASCGSCHISRPNVAGGGLLKGHAYLAQPSEEETCNACHGGTVGVEFTGKLEGLAPDVHLTQGEMGCLDCHTVEQMHGDGKTYASRREVESPDCLDCHDDIYAEGAANLAVHRDHKGKASCQVCHSQAYQNCSGCHVGKTAKGDKFFKVDAHKVAFYIGRNPNKSERHPEKFVVVRQAPAAPDTFKYYLGGRLPEFDKRPTFTYASPHNIQRKTAQASACNNCHGNQKLFLKGSDMPSDVRRANRKVMAIGDKIIPPKLREE